MNKKFKDIAFNAFCFIIPFSIVIGMIVMVALAIDGYFTEKFYLSENPALSKQFSISYKGEHFDTFKMKCYEDSATSTIQISGKETDFNNWGKYCLAEPSGILLRAVSIVEIVKTQGPVSSYQVFTTGEELYESYDPEMIERIKSTINSDLEILKDIRERDKSWFDAL